MAQYAKEVYVVADQEDEIEFIKSAFDGLAEFSPKFFTKKEIPSLFSSTSENRPHLMILGMRNHQPDDYKQLEPYYEQSYVIALLNHEEKALSKDLRKRGIKNSFLCNGANAKNLSRFLSHIVETKDHQSNLKNRGDYEQVITEMAAQFLNLPADQLETSIRETLEKISNFLGFSKVYLYLFDAEGEKAESVYGNKACSAENLAASFCFKEHPWLKAALMQKRLLSFDKVEQIPSAADLERKYFTECKLARMIRLPIVFQGKFRGLLCLDALQKSEIDIDSLVSLLEITGQLFINAHCRQSSESQMKKLKMAVEQSPSIVMLTDPNGIIEYVNSKFSEVTGYSSEEVLGKKPSLLKSDKVPQEEFAHLWKVIKEGKTWSGEFINRKKNGELYWERATISPIHDSSGNITHYLSLKEDITKGKWAEETIQHMAYYDPLTDLPNRMLFNDRLGQALAQARRKNQLAAILFLDLDRFKVINDTLGHTMGDLLLRAVAERLRKCSREGDTIARMGGDEFIFLLTGILEVDEAVKAAQSILEILKAPFNLEEHEVHITPSIGVSVYPYDGNDGVTLVKNADAALNRVKEQGRTNYQLYTPVMNAKAFERMTLENSLRKALEREEFTLYYQPQVDLGNGCIMGMEALLRWEHPDMGLVSPAQFIPMAEETGLIVSIGEWVLRTACEQNKKWQEMGYENMKVAVNLSARQFQEQDLVQMVSTCLKETGLSAEWLDIEITESIIMHNLEATIATLRDLHHLGLQISIDDFGTGYSSLSYLKKFPVHALKIDQSFIREITTDPDDAAITSAVIAMGHSLKLMVIAEGVETMDQLQLLKSLHCDRMQGYLFSRPVPAQTITPLLMEGWRLKSNQ
jgi:diguanylate cyclase (GGDEF)-like protein/PAS domain S-box-containing protein